MASVTLGTLRDYWKNVSQWVMGASASEPVVQLNGSYVEKLVADGVTVTAGSSYYPGVQEVKCDKSAFYVQSTTVTSFTLELRKVLDSNTEIHTDFREFFSVVDGEYVYSDLKEWETFKLSPFIKNDSVSDAVFNMSSFAKGVQ